jgi:polyisoprenoid-binding protein YceI
MLRHRESALYAVIDEEMKMLRARNMQLPVLVLLTSAALPSICRAEVPVFAIVQEDSSIRFHVSASVALDGTFDNWTGTLIFASPDVTTGVLNLEVQAASVDTGSGLKNSTLKGEDFFDVEENPTISFRSTKIMETGPDTFTVQGGFTIRGVSKPETLTVAVSGKGTGTGAVNGTMAFDRRDYGMNSGIPFIRIADRVEVTVDIKVKRVSGPPLVFKQ